MTEEATRALHDYVPCIKDMGVVIKLVYEAKGI